jgi:hypothetical protein
MTFLPPTIRTKQDSMHFVLDRPAMQQAAVDSLSGMPVDSR